MNVVVLISVDHFPSHFESLHGEIVLSPGCLVVMSAGEGYSREDQQAPISS